MFPKTNPEEYKEPDLQSHHITIFKRFSFQQKFTKYEKKQESLAHSQTKLTETIPKEADFGNLDKHLKSTVLNILKEVKKPENDKNDV